MPSESSHLRPAYPARARLSQTDLAYRNLRVAIVTWQVEPGAWLSEADLQELSGCGRTPTREGAARLVEDGLVTVMPRNGYQVADVSVEDTAALYDVWEALAPMTGQLAAGRVEEPAMRSLRRLATEPTAAGPDELLDVLEQLFDGVLRASGNPWLQKVGQRLFNHLQRLWVLTIAEGPRAGGTEAFGRMLAALDETSPQAAGDAFLRFTEWTRAQTLQAVERYTRERAAAGAVGELSR